MTDKDLTGGSHWRVNEDKIMGALFKEEDMGELVTVYITQVKMRCDTCLFAKRISKLKGSKYVCKKPQPNPLWEHTFSGDFGCVNYKGKGCACGHVKRKDMCEKCGSKVSY
jgi:hypothetical protein